MIWIYSIQSAGKVLYVGQSTKPEHRFMAILTKQGIPWGERDKYKLKLLQKTNLREALNVESNTIKSFWKLGQCLWNKVARCGAVGLRSGRSVICLSTGQEFDSVGAAARSFKVSTASINKWIKTGKSTDWALDDYDEPLYFAWGDRKSNDWPAWFQGANI